MAPPDFTRYVEPFAGSAALFFALQPKRALLSDLNGELINSYNQVVRCPIKISRKVAELPRTKEVFYSLRSQDPKALNRFDRAVRFLYLNRNCFNGLYRTNRGGSFNVPFAPAKTGQFPDESQMAASASLLRRASIKKCDYSATLEAAEKGDFVYLDPPFAVINRRIFEQYDPSSFGYGDLDHLAGHLVELDKGGVKFLISYAWNKDVTPRFRRWNLNRIRVARNIAGFALHRRGAYEMIATNY